MQSVAGVGSSDDLLRPSDPDSSNMEAARGKSPAQDLVRQMRAEGLSDERMRAQLKAKGFSKTRISQLLLLTAPRPTGHKQLVEQPSPTKKRGPPITLDELRQLGEASALEAAREIARSGSPISARMSCQYLGVSTGPHTYSSAAQALRNSTLVFAWRLAANGQERTALARKFARCDAIAKYVPLPVELKNILNIEAQYAKVLAEAKRVFPGTTFNLRLGVPRKLEPPANPHAPGATVMLCLPFGRRAEHVLCAHISGDLWYCHAGSPKEGGLNAIDPFRAEDLVIRSLASCWRPWQLQRKRLLGRCVKRNLATAATEKRPCFERLVAIAIWKAEAHRAQQRGVPMDIAAASAGVDFTDKAFGAAIASPWTSKVLAVWQWGEKVLDADPGAHLVGDIEMRYALRSASYRIFCSMPESVLPDSRFVSGMRMLRRG